MMPTATALHGWRPTAGSIVREGLQETADVPVRSCNITGGDGRQTRQHRCRLVNMSPSPPDQHDADGRVQFPTPSMDVSQRPPSTSRWSSRVLLVGPRHRQIEDPVVVFDFDMFGHSSSPLGNLVWKLASQRATISISAVSESLGEPCVDLGKPGLRLREGAARPACVNHSTHHARPSSRSARRLIRPATVIRSTRPLMPGGPRSNDRPGLATSKPRHAGPENDRACPLTCGSR